MLIEEEPDRFRLEFSYVRQSGGEIYRGRRKQDNPNDASTVYEVETAHLSWTPERKLRMNLLVPWVEIVNETTAGGSKTRRHLKGLGDMAVYAEWWPWQVEGRAERKSDSAADDDAFPGFFNLQGISLVGGMKFPTGRENESIIPGETPPSLLQRGTGTYDPIVGFAFQSGREHWRFSHATVAQITGGASEFGFRPGSSVRTSFGVTYEIDKRISPWLNLEGQFTDKDVLNSDSIDNTGSSFIFVTPGVSIGFFQPVDLDVSLRFPIYRNVDANQLVPEEVWTIAISKSF